MKSTISLALLTLTALAAEHPTPEAGLQVHPRWQVENAVGSGKFTPMVRTEIWKPAETAVLFCDVWDSHHSKNAADRTAELAPRMEELARFARSKGCLIIHSPSDCMAQYEGHPARKRAQEAPAAANLPPGIEKWLHWKDEREQKAGYPIDASDGGQDDSQEQLAAWHKALEGQGRKPNSPWLKQIATIQIDPERDAISDRGPEVWNLLESRGIKNVIFCGVHTNMCVLGRPFGLRQLSRNGKNVVLVRDLTDTMYNPAMPPKVSHFQGTELVIGHVERYVCPTITSDQLLGGQPFTFKGDSRKHLVAVIGEDEYKTSETLPAFLEKHLSGDFRVSLVLADQATASLFPGFSQLTTADVLLVSVRRRPLPARDLETLRQWVDSGKPVVGIRTASHAWSLRNKAPPDGHQAWPEWDAEVLGGNYSNHYGKDTPPTISIVAAQKSHPILAGLGTGPFPSTGSLYRNTPLRPGTTLLLEGTLPDGKCEPVAWVHQTKAGGRVFYTSLGHPEEFQMDYFQKLLSNGIRWAAGL